MGRVRSLLATLRVANFPSVASNVAVGAAVVVWSGGGFVWPGLILAIVAGGLLYAGGNLLNDWKDHDWDRLHRPERALPRGLFAPSTYLLCGSFCLLTGFLFAYRLHPGAGGTAAGIALLVWIYTLSHKRTAVSVLPMGLCRALLPLMGAVSVKGGWVERPEGLVWWAALLLWVYVICLSLEARGAKGRLGAMATRILLILPASAWIVADATGHALGAGCATLFYLLWWLLVGATGPNDIGRRVSLRLAGIPWVDACFLFPIAGAIGGWGLLWAVVPVAAVLAGLWLQRVAPAT